MEKQATYAIVTAFQQQKDKALHPIHIMRGPDEAINSLVEGIAHFTRNSLYDVTEIQWLAIVVQC